MSVQQKLIECEKSLIHSPVDKIAIHLDIKIKNMLESIISNSNELISNKELLMTPPASSTTSSSADFKDDNNNHFNSINSSSNRSNIEYLVNSLRDFKVQAIEVEKALDENSSLLK